MSSRISCIVRGEITVGGAARRDIVRRWGGRRQARLLYRYRRFYVGIRPDVCDIFFVAEDPLDAHANKVRDNRRTRVSRRSNRDNSRAEWIVRPAPPPFCCTALSQIDAPPSSTLAWAASDTDAHRRRHFRAAHAGAAARATGPGSKSKIDSG
ncbi:hypothetical protein [Burkholderia sp. Ac-20379]|uniref:hypothetical protein n=1 Tax=Burkholderia sp. Ac-20379 TaxID=2703900 RepID=UPI00197D9DC0|nr:hypothetical protein [Burkholderia sp. Ac-20379]MBN3725078.1 hypothetical protein [Burkholderia sp. Ac-20379]